MICLVSMYHFVVAPTSCPLPIVKTKYICCIESVWMSLSQTGAWEDMHAEIIQQCFHQKQGQTCSY